MKRLSVLNLVFAIASALFFLVLILFRFPFPLFPLMSYQDALDLLTPLVLLPFSWYLYKLAGRAEPGRSEELAFILFAAIWALGHGIHLSANSINNLAGTLARNQVIDITGTPVYELTYFYDEPLSHVLWHIGIMGLIGLLLYREWRQPAGVATIWWAAGAAGLIYGFTFFAIVLEGGTVPLGLPFSAVVLLASLIWGRKLLAQRPMMAFFFVTFLVAALLFAGWGYYWGGFPQFTEVGLI